MGLFTLIGDATDFFGLNPIRDLERQARDGINNLAEENTRRVGTEAKDIIDHYSKHADKVIGNNIQLLGFVAKDVIDHGSKKLNENIDHLTKAQKEVIDEGSNTFVKKGLEGKKDEDDEEDEDKDEDDEEDHLGYFIILFPFQLLNCNIIFGLLFLLLVLIIGVFAYEFFFDQEIEIEQEKQLIIEFTEVDHAYFTIKAFIVSAYDQIPCASTWLKLIFGLILPCLFVGHFLPRLFIHHFIGSSNRQQQMDEIVHQTNEMPNNTMNRQNQTTERGRNRQNNFSSRNMSLEAGQGVHQNDSRPRWNNNF